MLAPRWLYSVLLRHPWCHSSHFTEAPLSASLFHSHLFLLVPGNQSFEDKVGLTSIVSMAAFNRKYRKEGSRSNEQILAKKAVSRVFLVLSFPFQLYKALVFDTSSIVCDHHWVCQLAPKGTVWWKTQLKGADLLYCNVKQLHPVIL